MRKQNEAKKQEELERKEIQEKHRLAVRPGSVIFVCSPYVFTPSFVMVCNLTDSWRS